MPKIESNVHIDVAIRELKRPGRESWVKYVVGVVSWVRLRVALAG